MIVTSDAYARTGFVAITARVYSLEVFRSPGPRHPRAA